MTKINKDHIMRINVEKIAHEPGHWLSPPRNGLIILESAIFESLFSYIAMASESAKIESQYDIGPEKIMNELMKQAELEVIDALIKAYNRRRTSNGKK